jgi:hypothetical protein
MMPVLDEVGIDPGEPTFIGIHIIKRLAGGGGAGPPRERLRFHPSAQ